MFRTQTLDDFCSAMVEHVDMAPELQQKVFERGKLFITQVRVSPSTPAMLAPPLPHGGPLAPCPRVPLGVPHPPACRPAHPAACLLGG